MAGLIVPAICRAALAFAKKDYAACAHILEPVAADVARIGGSVAQRDMFEDMLLATYRWNAVLWVSFFPLSIAVMALAVTSSSRPRRA